MGKDQQGHTFGQVFPNFRETYLSLFTCFLKSAFRMWYLHKFLGFILIYFTAAEIHVSRVLGGTVTIARNHEGSVEATGDIDVDVDGEESSLFKRGQIDVQLTNGPSKAESNNIEEGQKDVEQKPEDNDTVTHSPSSPAKPLSPPPPASPPPLPPPASPPPPPSPRVHSREVTPIPHPPAMSPAGEDLVSERTATNVKEKSNTEDVTMDEVTDQLPTEMGGSIAESNTMKHQCPCSCPLSKHAPIEDGLVTTWEKRARMGLAPKEILTLAERARQVNGGEDDLVVLKAMHGGKGPSKCSRRGK